MLVVVVLGCALAVTGLARCVGGAPGNHAASSAPAWEEKEGVATEVPELDVDGNGLVDVRVDVDELDASAKPEGAGWYVGSASAYSLEDNTGGTATASGIPLDESSLTVAVSQEAAGLLGATVEIFYGGISVTAMVTDTGAFEDYGRTFDLAPAVWRAFGADTVEDWGVRDVSYRFVAQDDSGGGAE